MSADEEQTRFEETIRSTTPRRILANVRRLLPRYKRRTLNWVLAMEVYAVGSNYAHWICHEHGIDPDGITIDPFSNHEPTPSKARQTEEARS